MSMCTCTCVCVCMHSCVSLCMFTCKCTCHSFTSFFSSTLVLHTEVFCPNCIFRIPFLHFPYYFMCIMMYVKSSQWYTGMHACVFVCGRGGGGGRENGARGWLGHGGVGGGVVCGCVLCLC